MAHKQRKYDHEYKVQAVKLAKEISGAKAAKELGIPEGTIHTWLKAVRAGTLDIGNGAHTPESAIVIKTEDGVIKGKFSFYCRMLGVSRQGFCKYLANKAGVFILSEIFGEKEALFTSRQQALYGKINSYLYDCLANFPVVGQLHNGKYLCGRLRGLHKRGSREVIRGLSRYMALSDAMLTFMTNTLPLLAFALGLLFAKKGWMTTGETIAVMLLAQKLNEPIILLSYLILDKKNAQGVYDRVKDIYEDTQDAGGDKKAEAFENMQVAITEYRYENADKAALCDVRFTIEKGDVVLLKGESGAGKTTAIKLLSRLTSLQGLRGKIQYNDRNISEYDTKEYYKHVLQVEQETVLVEGSVLENLLLGEHYGEGDIREVLHVCVLEDFCRERGLDFHIKESGKNISGGERQRIGIARMLLRKPELLILDEVTSALDETTRQLLADRLIAFQKRYRMTIVAISHNKEFEKYSNRIIGL